MLRRMGSTTAQQASSPTGPWHIGDRLAKARNEAVDGTLNQTELGLKLQVSRATVGKYEEGDIDMAKPEIRRTVMRWAMATGWHYTWLRDGTGPWLADGPDGGVTASDLRDAVFARSGRTVCDFPEIRLLPLAG